MSSDQSVRTLSLSATRVGKDNQPDQVLIRTPEWMDDAKCRNAIANGDGDLAFPATKADAYLFVRCYCTGCPVIQECADHAIRHKVEYGVYGGKVIGRDYLQETA
jgi:Fe-S cluster biogenesis protein NfuA